MTSLIEVGPLIQIEWDHVYPNQMAVLHLCAMEFKRRVRVIWTALTSKRASTSSSSSLMPFPSSSPPFSPPLLASSSSFAAQSEVPSLATSSPTFSLNSFPFNSTQSFISSGSFPAITGIVKPAQLFLFPKILILFLFVSLSSNSFIFLSFYITRFQIGYVSCNLRRLMHRWSDGDVLDSLLVHSFLLFI